MSALKRKRALGRLPGTAAPSYDVGYGKPPSNTRFKPGQSGNPRGRPRGAKNKANHMPGLNDQHLKAMVLEEAYRTITVRDGNRLVELPVAQAMVRGIIVSGLKGDKKSQQMFIGILSGTERENKMLHDTVLAAAIEYKADWKNVLKRCELTGEKGPEPLPNPDDITIDVGSGRVEIRGPMTEEEKSLRDALPRIRAECDKEIATLEELAAVNPNSRFVQQQLNDRRRMRDRLSKVRLQCPPIIVSDRGQISIRH